MCGIFGYVGKGDGLALCLEGIKTLEYRGYDSSGIAAIKDDGSLFTCKRVGKIDLLQKALVSHRLKSHVAIAHTRWATHGAATENNAHPHTDRAGRLALVHNGVIENYEKLKLSLIEKSGAIFVSETDTEVASHLIARHMDDIKAKQDSKGYGSRFLEGCVKSFLELKGSFAIAVIHKDFPSEMIAVAENSPLIVALDPKTMDVFIASDPSAFLGKKLQMVYLQNGEIASITYGSPPLFFNKQGAQIEKKAVENHVETSTYQKGIFPHFMLKEIFQQEEVLEKMIKSRGDRGDSFPELKHMDDDLASLEHITIIGCGSSYHAACIAAHFFEEIAKVDCRVEIASEFRYDAHAERLKGIVIALSQSGETADTLACVEMCKAWGLKVISLCNVEGSSLTRLSDATLYLMAGPERAVASTKTFSAQLCMLFLFSLYLGRKKGSIDEEKWACFYKELQKIPHAVADVLEEHRKIEVVAKKYATHHDFYFLGRGVLFPTALEAALKLKEIAYKNAVGYPAGEMKHGPIALLDSTVPTVVLCCSLKLEKKIISNLRESRARQSPIIVIGWQMLASDYSPYSDDVLFIPPSMDILSPIVVTVASQLFAYYVAQVLCLDIDQPRNLAKSVTVE